MRKPDHYCGKWKFYFAGLLKGYCVWKKRAVLVLEQGRSISQQTHNKGFNLFVYFLGPQPLVQMFVMERCLWAFTVLSLRHFILLLPLIFVLQWPKQEKSTWVLHLLYKSSLWNLIWPAWPLLPLCWQISLLALLFLRQTSDWWPGLAHQEVNPARRWGEGAQPRLYPLPWVLLSDRPKAWL